MTDVADIDDVAEEGAEGAEETSGKKSKLKLLIIIGAAALLVALAAGAGIYFFLLQGAADDTAADPAAIAAEMPAYVYQLDPITVNLSSTDPDPQFLKLTVALELADKEVADAIAPRMARVMDAFQVYLRELRPTDLNGSAGVYRLKEELRRRVNLAIYPVEVQNILFTEILVQ